MNDKRRRDRRPGGRRLQLESLEDRMLLAGDVYQVNFQLAGATVPTRYLPDTGLVYGDRGGVFYGWSSDHTSVSRERLANADQRLDTLIHFHQNQKWELGLPNGTYEVTVSIGDPSFASTHTLNVEGVNYWNAVPLAVNEFRKMTVQIAVADGRLTLDQGAAGEMATRINYVQVVGLPSGPNQSPAAPTITEPLVDGQIVNPSDVHMEGINFVDGDGNLHKSTDWEIWETTGAASLVWQTLGIEGVERLHTHLGDGVFVGEHAGRTDLVPNSPYELRVRFRDDAGSVSAYAVRTFITGAASTVFPLEVENVADATPPQWLDALSSIPVLLAGASPNQSQLRLESAAGDLLLAITATGGVSNAVTNPPTLADHADVRVVIVAGSNGLFRSASNLGFLDDHDAEHTIYLPALSLAPNERLDLWAASDGSTYYGLSSQTVPVFSTLARASEASIENPFTAMQAHFVVEPVATGFQLPTNIAFVPNPGPNPDDPYYYVTELYGTVKVVARNGSIGTYATGLLNFNPTGSFPGSGEQGLTGIAVDPVSGDVFVSRVTATDPLNPNGAHHPQVVRFHSNDGGKTAATTTVIRNMPGETQGQSHQISNVTVGPDGKLYVHNGDGFDASTALNLNSYRGKILRMNLDGTAPADNPFYNAGDGINARDYVYAYGFRNPFGGAWRAADGKHYEVENGNSIDRFAQVNRGVSYNWAGSDTAMLTNAIYNWNPAHAPVNIAFVESPTFGGSAFPPNYRDVAYVTESGSTYALGPQSNGKRVVFFQLDAAGNRLSGPTTLVEYTGNGRGTAAGLAAGPDGLYFTELYKDLDAATPIDAGARIFRIRYVPAQAGDATFDGAVDGADVLAWQRTLGSRTSLSADVDRSLSVDAADVDYMRTVFGAAAASLSASNDQAAVAAQDAAFAAIEIASRMAASNADSDSATTLGGRLVRGRFAATRRADF